MTPGTTTGQGGRRAARPGQGSAASTEPGRDRFPPPVDVIAHLLILANQQRIALTLQEARATSVTGLATFRKRHAAADEAVERQVRLIRKLLGLPPPETG
jgi:hypothetical protein